MRGMRGTVAYWTDILQNLLATVKSLGPPTLFLTLSANNTHWPELGMLLRNCSYSETTNIPSFLSDMRKDPLMASIHFERRWKSFFIDVLRGKDAPLGIIEDWFA